MERELNQINVIPLVDVMLVLLVIVLTTATFISTGQVPVELAKAKEVTDHKGLERVDRALAALGASNDATWASMRDAQVKEVAEVRSWMADYRAKGTWAMK